MNTLNLNLKKYYTVWYVYSLETYKQTRIDNKNHKRKQVKYVSKKIQNI